jgi:hypothetical protein
VVEAGVKFVSGRWWRTLAAKTLSEAQLSLDRFCATKGDARLRPPGQVVDPEDLHDLPDHPKWPSVGELADQEPLLRLPVACYPATIECDRVVTANATVLFRGNAYSVVPGLSGSTLKVSHRLSSRTVEIHSASGLLFVSHRLAPAGAGATVRSPEHKAALSAAVLSSFTMARPCDRKENRPPSAAAMAEAARLRGDLGKDPTVDLQEMAALFEDRRSGS